MITAILQDLGIEPTNFGASYSHQWWSNTTDYGTIQSMSPTNNNLIAKIHSASQQDLEHIIQTSQQAFLQWREMPAPKRGAIVREIGELLREKKSALGSLVSYEMGKSKQEGDGEVQEMIDMVDFAVGQSRMLYGLSMHSERPSHRMYEQWHPLGIIGVITSFNFPVAVWAWNAMIAAICGNTIIWRPSSKTPLCAIAIQQICNQVMQRHNLEAVFSIFISEDKALANQFVADNRIPLISFTGSSQVGKQVYETVASRMGRCLLECSGNNAVIVDETADLQLAVPAIVFGAIGTAGQRCTTIRRLIVHEKIAKKLMKHLKTAYQKIQVGNPLDTNNLMGPLIDQSSKEKYLKTINEIKNLKGKILFGGNAIDSPGFYVEPTIVLADAKWDVVKSETFAPILYIMTYQTIDEAIAIQNNVEQGLSSAIFTQNLKHTEKFLSAAGSDCGIANVNISTSGAEIGGAFGGEKSTGGGREAGSDAWKTYMRRQTVTINWGDEVPLAQGIEFKL